MKKTTLLKTMLLLCALVVGSSSAWADESTIDVRNTASVVFEPRFGTDGTSYKSTNFTLTSKAGTTYSGWSRTNVALGDARMAIKASGSFTSPSIVSTSGYSVEITYTFSSTSSASVSIKIGSDDAVSSTSEGTLKAITTSTNASFKISAGSTRAVYITKLVIKPYPEIPETAFDATPVATISKSTGAIESKTWTMTDNSDYTMVSSNNDLAWDTTNSDYFKITYPYTFTITVPSGITVSKIGITGFSNNTSTGTNITVGSTTKNFTTEKTEIFDIATPTSGNSISFSSAAKVMYIKSIVLYTADGITLTTSANMAGWRAFYDATQGYTLDANTKAYIATETDASTVKLKEIDDVPAGTPVILHTSSSADNYKMTLAKAASTSGDATGNILAVTDGTNDVTNKYRLGYLAGEGNGVGFYPYSATKPAAGIVYLDVSSASARALTLDFGEGETTGIAKANVNLNANVNYFDLQGRRVAQPTKGLYIVNGKKMVIK